ncbi:DNA N-glycosylase and apurinic/apyrimidinic (AP) lyase [Rhizophlyctis rosea]|uniref:DNA-(apurinic or apyrimidinic site) lyase n=1 Tax=Rhizophlyctis rosea TaxID=64517 RepID=A0AAD5S6W2_9FUNG|nr:DNA N-glycosylase and apurinic/apyrimidinic (AP) lyase [Rhizophlyctis rosea]
MPSPTSPRITSLVYKSTKPTSRRAYNGKPLAPTLQPVPQLPSIDSTHSTHIFHPFNGHVKAEPFLTAIKREEEEHGVSKVEDHRTVETKEEKNNGVSRTGPKNWQDIWESTYEYRTINPADVDTLGCAFQADTNAPPKDQRFQTLISLIISAGTTDKQVSHVMTALKRHPSGCNVESILAMSDEELMSYIAHAGKAKKNTEYIKQAARTCKEKYDGDIPPTYETLQELRGVGRKVARLTEQFAWGAINGIGVDTHVNRITRRWGWVTPPPKKDIPKDKQAQQTEEELMGWLPREHWLDINRMLVGFGQIMCKDRITRNVCDECPVTKFCPKIGVVVGKGSKKEEESMKMEIDAGGLSFDVGKKEEDMDVHVKVEVEQGVEVKNRKRKLLTSVKRQAVKKVKIEAPEQVVLGSRRWSSRLAGKAVD